MRKILPILLILIGIGGGIGAGLLLRPDPAAKAALPECAPVEIARGGTAGAERSETAGAAR